MVVGHSQAQHMVKIQPMKMASAEALWETADPASCRSSPGRTTASSSEVFAIRIPRLLSLLAYNRFSGQVKGINDLQAEYEAALRPGDYSRR